MSTHDNPRFQEDPPRRIYALRGGLSFASMMAIWSCMAFHLSGAPFYAGSDAVGLLGLCGLAGAMAASGIGKFLPRFGVERFCCAGSALQFAAWAFALCLPDTYIGLIIAIILADIGAQCHQLSNQSACPLFRPGDAPRFRGDDNLVAADRKREVGDVLHLVQQLPQRHLLGP